MTITYDPTTSVGRVRLLVADNDVGGVVRLEDEEIEALLDMRGSNVHLAAASALRIFANNEALILKRIRLLDLDLNGPAVAESLRRNADALEAEVDEAATVEITD